MLVFRIEHANGGGPYREYLDKHPSTSSRLQKHHNGSDAHPVAPEDCLVGWGHKLQCGFTSLSQLREWFRGQFGFLDNHGCKLVMYQTTETPEIGLRQCLFDVKSSKRLCTVSLRHVV